MLCVSIPSYNRSKILKLSLNSFLKNKYIDMAIVIASSSNLQEYNNYQKILKNIKGNVKYEISMKRISSVDARNKLLKLASEVGCDYLIMSDDDFYLKDTETPKRMLRWLNEKEIGLVGGKVITIRREKTDPDFFLNLKIADKLSDITGYVFLDIIHGPRFASFSTPFFAIKRELFDKISYDKKYKIPTAFREESDLQMQVRKLGYKILFDPNSWVYGLAIDEGGNRTIVSEHHRIYWKSYGSSIFINKWNEGFKRIFKLVTSTYVLILYKPQFISIILKGLRDALYDYS